MLCNNWQFEKNTARLIFRNPIVAAAWFNQKQISSISGLVDSIEQALSCENRTMKIARKKTRRSRHDHSMNVSPSFPTSSKKNLFFCILLYPHFYDTPFIFWAFAGSAELGLLAIKDVSVTVTNMYSLSSSQWFIITKKCSKISEATQKQSAPLSPFKSARVNKRLF